MLRTKKRDKTKLPDGDDGDGYDLKDVHVAEPGERSMVVLHSIHMQTARLPGNDKTFIVMYLEDVDGNKTKLYAFTPDMLNRLKDLIAQVEGDL